MESGICWGKYFIIVGNVKLYHLWGQVVNARSKSEYSYMAIRGSGAP